MTLQEIFKRCEEAGISAELVLESGKYVSGTDLFDASGKRLRFEDIPPERIQQGERGYRVSISNISFESNLYPTLDEATLAMERLLEMVLRKKQ